MIPDLAQQLALGGLSPALRRGLMELVGGLKSARGQQAMRDRIASATRPEQVLEAFIESGLPADVNRPFTYNGREFWRDIHRDMLNELQTCVESSAQVGKTISDFVVVPTRAWFDTFKNRGGWFGLYLPTQEMVIRFSQGRFDPIVKHAAAIAGAGPRPSTSQLPREARRRVREALKAEGADKEIDSYNFKRIGLWWVFLGWINGAIVDGFPVDRLLLDEVRLMDPGLVDRAEKRTLGSDVGSVIWTSTAGMPGDAIAVRWDQSTQKYWHHPCNCPDGVALNLHWPECLGTREGKQAELHGRFFLRCPRCGVEIKDRTAGRWLEHNPGGLYPGYKPNQLMTRLPLERIASNWMRADRNTKEFYNSVLGLNFLDPEATPITQAILQSAVNDDLMWAKPGDVRGAALGVDHHLGCNYYVVSVKTDAGKRRIVHLEMDWAADPFQRAAKLMHQYEVGMAVLEPLPNASGALRFAQEFPGRVFLVRYTRNQGAVEAIQGWYDLNDDAVSKRLVDADLKTPFQVAVNQRLALDTLADHWREGRAEVPDDRGLRQRALREDGTWFTVETCREVYFDHLQRIARRSVTETKLADGVDVREKTGRVNYHWVKLAKSPSGSPRAPVRGASSDPHFAFAELLNWVAWTRVHQHGHRAISPIYI